MIKMMNNVIVKRCNLEDINTLQEFSRQTFFETYKELCSTNDINLYSNYAFNLNNLENELTNPDSTFFFLYYNHILVGYLKLNEARAQTELNDEDAIEIERLYIASNFQKRGYGQYLIDYATDYAQEKGKKYIWLSVWQKNKKAINFYRKNGFRENGTHTFVIGHDEQIDYIMSKPL